MHGVVNVVIERSAIACLKLLATDDRHVAQIEIDTLRPSDRHSSIQLAAIAKRSAVEHNPAGEQRAIECEN